ncbi:MAG: PIN domain-containing protein [Planctomycetes bacterium]|nr:PIN domain-containing protein [Planctomycetota bacterium]
MIEEVLPGPIGLDTAIFIYFIEEHPDYLGILDPLFQAVDRGVLQCVTSAITLLETLVVPYRAGDTALAERYEELLTRSAGVRLVELDRGLLKAAAHLRGRLCLRTPDALQIAAALAAGCTKYLTNDRRLPAIPRLSVLQLDDYRSV